MQTAVINWFATHARALPWRRPGTSAWGVLLSEVMSQQTPVARVEPFWLDWMQRWPTPTDVAAAPRDEVLRAWGNLGYPRRALRLHDCATVLVDRWAGEVPDTVEDLLTLPGIGDYTARAIACFHYHLPVPVVDTNVRRVYRRALEGEFLVNNPSKRDLEKVGTLLEGLDPVDTTPFSTGLMELGALICTAHNPRCVQCPINSHCAWQLRGCPEPSDVAKTAAKKRVQKFKGTDRQVRGIIMGLLRDSSDPVSMADIDVAWPDEQQRRRALESLFQDGLVEWASEVSSENASAPAALRLPR